ncbi:MAG: HDIG domain-containing protein [Desulforegulaceae bacterium]|nr:HDIG domain-containing protein [Desulforegulaceae bacterium]
MKNRNHSQFFKKLGSGFDSPIIIPVSGIIIAAIFAFFVSDLFYFAGSDYKIGDIAPKTIKSIKYTVFEHPGKTEEKKREAASGVFSVYDLDSRMINETTRMIDLAFESGKKELEKIEKNPEDQPFPNLAAKKNFETHLGFEISQGAFNLLIENKFSEDLNSILKQIVVQILENGVVSNKNVLMKEEEKGITLRDIYTGEETFTSRLKRFYGPDQAQTMVRIIGDPLLKNYSYNIVNLIVDFAQRLIRPNITINQNETQERVYQAVENVPPVLYQINKGEIIVRKGDVINPLQMIKLNAYQKENNTKEQWLGVMGKSISILFFIIAIYMTFLKNLVDLTSNSNKNILFLTLVIIFNIILAKLLSIVPTAELSNGGYTIPDTAVKIILPVAASSMIVCLFFGQYQAYSIAIICAFICAMIFETNVAGLFIFFLINGVMGTFWIKECRERQVFVKAGAKLALLNLIVAPAFLIQIPQISMFEIAIGMLFAATGGLLSGILTGGISPLLEIIFGYSSDIKLMELSNPEQKLLRRLMLEAPGTYNHSMIVGTMAEAAAAEINANSILARVGGYYHDIGKLNKPLYFIENQRHGKNPHDKLSPSMSMLILTAHVKDGIALAKKYKLPEAVTAIISQHHGTSLIRYFYEKAKQKTTEKEPLKNHYKYPGPKPQSRVAAIVMLADITEAATRSLDNPSVSRIQGVVHKLINSTFSDNQLDECNLTLKDLHKIAKIFNKILSGIHHHRIKYIEEEKEESKKDGNPPPKQEKPVQDNKPKPSEEDGSYLKRLGL